MTQQVKALAIKSDNLSLSPGPTSRRWASCLLHMHKKEKITIFLRDCHRARGRHGSTGVGGESMIQLPHMASLGTEFEIRSHSIARLASD